MSTTTTTTVCCPDAPHFQVRALGIRTATAGPAILRELAYKAIAVAGTECHIPDLPDYEWAAFDPNDADPPEALPRCTAATLAGAIWDDPPTALLCHDVSRLREPFGPGLTHSLPWVCTRRVAARLWPHAPTHALSELVVWLELHAGPRFDQLCAGDQPSAVVDVALTLLLFGHQLRLAGSLAEMIRLSASPAPPHWSAMPTPWGSEEEWEEAANSTDDLWVWSRAADPGACGREPAKAELDRRRRAGHRLPDPDLRMPQRLLPQLRSRPPG